MSEEHRKIILAGYICLDMTPDIGVGFRSFGDVFQPGNLVQAGPIAYSAGGAVANTGTALCRLGHKVELVARIGNDALGDEVLRCLATVEPGLGRHLLREDGDHTAYALVFSAPGVERMFLVYQGANDSFDSGDVSDEAIAGASWLHFGYPPIMERMCSGQGERMAELFARAKGHGLTTSLDMVKPSAEVLAQTDWRAFLHNVLPHTDFFCPSLEEIYNMLHPGMDLGALGRERPDEAMLREMAGELLALGAAVVVIKLGEHGLYVRTSSDAGRLERIGAGGPSPVELEAWVGQEFHMPCYSVEVAGTNGAGDSTIAGLISGVIQGLPLEEAARFACAVGAFSVEGSDATGAIPRRERVWERTRAGWAQRETLPG
ncbi:MAG: carbohydrate kinase PfkB [Paenibacillaceae bacterium]|nr:carbohydrate kinase PfkB [Paenibacillaceae bacterium]